MKKILIILAVLIAIIAVGATVFLGKLDDIIADAIRTEGTNAIGTQVSVTDVVTNLKTGSAVINGLSIANPAGYQSKNAFSVNQFKTKVDYANQTIEEIIINNPTVNAELKGTKSNFQTLMESMPETSSETEETTDTDDMIITIKRLAITQTQVNLLSEQLGAQSFQINDLIMTNLIGTPDQLAQQVTSKLTQFISDEVKGFATAALKQKLKEKLDEGVEQAKGKAKEKLNEAVADKLGDKLKGFKLKLR